MNGYEQRQLYTVNVILFYIAFLPTLAFLSFLQVLTGSHDCFGASRQVGLALLKQVADVWPSLQGEPCSCGGVCVFICVYTDAFRRGVAITGCVWDTDIPQEVRVGTIVLHIPALAKVTACSGWFILFLLATALNAFSEFETPKFNSDLHSNPPLSIFCSIIFPYVPIFRQGGWDVLSFPAAMGSSCVTPGSGLMGVYNQTMMKHGKIHGEDDQYNYCITTTHPWQTIS